VPVHRALTEPILLGGAPRSLAILNGTLAAALGLGLRLWSASALGVGHFAAVWAAKRDPQFVDVVRRICASPVTCQSEERAMMNLAEYRNRNTRLADFLPWAALVGEGVVLNKDGSLQRTARFAAPTSTAPCRPSWSQSRPAQQRLPSSRLWLGNLRRSAAPRAATYPAATSRRASALVDAERKADFEEAGAHFESAISSPSLSAAGRGRRARRNWLYEGRDHGGVDAHEVLHGFTDRTDRIFNLSKPSCRNAAGSMTARR
jgi:type IV secretory pathway TrbD component